MAQANTTGYETNGDPRVIQGHRSSPRAYKEKGRGAISTVTSPVVADTYTGLGVAYTIHGPTPTVAIVATEKVVAELEKVYEIHSAPGAREGVQRYTQLSGQWLV